LIEPLAALPAEPMTGSPPAGNLASVIMPAHNAAREISGALASLASEAEVIGEIIVVDDSSTDGTGAVARQTGESLGLPVRVVAAAFRDAGRSRNLALSHARAAWIYFMDADDRHASGGLRRLMDRAARAPAPDLVIGAYVRHVNGVNRGVKTPGRYGPSGARNAADYLVDRMCAIATGCVLARRAAVADIRFPTGLAYDEDTLFWTEIMTRAATATIDDVIMTYNVSPARADHRLVTTAGPSFRRWRKQLRALARAGVDVKAIATREGLIALKIARAKHARGEYGSAMRFIVIAKAAPWQFSQMWRRMRYTVRILARSCLARISMRDSGRSKPTAP
jgi:glycosyltransferase involved in cell wall biosynthesis